MHDLTPARLYEHANKASRDAIDWRDSNPGLAELRRRDAERLRYKAREMLMAEQLAGGMLEACLRRRVTGNDFRPLPPQAL
jgi:hypothetical protein